MKFFRIDNLSIQYTKKELSKIIQEYMYIGNLTETKNKDEILPIFLDKLQKDSLDINYKKSDIGELIYKCIKDINNGRNKN